MSKGHVINGIAAIGHPEDASCECSSEDVLIKSVFNRSPVVGVDSWEAYSDYYCYTEPHHLYNNQIPSVSSMKALSNTQPYLSPHLDKPKTNSNIPNKSTKD